MTRILASAAVVALILAPLAMARSQTAPGAAPSAGSTAAQVDQAAAVPVTRSDVKNVQRELKAEGLYAGKVDGIVGPQTKEAVGTYQKEHGLPQTATIDQETARRIGGPRGRRAWRAGR